ncbi:MAG TPA: type II secretion system F family protein [Candidatus Limnocylindria bacterium]
MIVIGAISAGAAAMLVTLATRNGSPVERRLRAVGGPTRTRRMIWSGTDPLVPWKATSALAGALAGCGAAAISSLGPVAVIAPAYAGWVLPSVLADRRVTRRRRDADRAVITLVEWLHALVASGRPLESALAAVGAQPSGAMLLDTALARARRDYVLGVPMHSALARHGREFGLSALTDLAARIERSRDLGRGVLPLLQDLRDELRAQETSRCLAVASQVEGKLTLVLTLCYLPALALLVIVPLFLTLLTGLFN